MTMREILFRGKRVKPVALVSQWILGNYVFKADGSLPGLGKHFIVVHDGFGLSQWVEVDPTTVGQYTGLTDKNGKKIFEGDIVKVSHTIHLPDEEQHLPRKAYGGNYTEIGEYAYFRNYAVKWNGKEGGWVIRNGSDGRRIHSNYVYYHGCEVIGNIYDNPELMEGENHG